MACILNPAAHAILAACVWAFLYNGSPTASPVQSGGTAKDEEVVSALAGNLATRIAGYRHWRTGTVTDVSRKGFRVNLGLSDGVRPGLEAQVLRVIEGEDFGVATAEVLQADDESAFLRRTDRLRRRAVREGDVVRIAGGSLRVLVGGLGGNLPSAVSESIRSNLLRSLEESSGVTALDGPRFQAEGKWPWQPDPGLCRSATERGCSHALAGWAEIKGDSLHVVVGLIDASKIETVELYAGSAKMDAALAAIASDRPASAWPSGAGAQAPGALSAYATRLQPAFEATMPGGVVAVQVLSDRRAICVAGENAIVIYKIHPGDERLQEVASYAIDSPPYPVRCRDPFGTLGLMDSDSDGLDEMVLWSSILSGPAAFSISAGGSDGAVELERAATFWLPWADPLGASNFVAGENLMSAPSSLGSNLFHSWKTADLDGDGVPEVVLTEVDGSLTVRDSSLAVIGRKAGVGAALAVCDMNGDGIEEIVATSSCAPDAQDSIAFYNWSGTDLEETWRVGGLRAGVVSISAGYLDPDDSPDLVAAFNAGPRARYGRLLVFLTSAP